MTYNELWNEIYFVIVKDDVDETQRAQEVSKRLQFLKDLPPLHEESEELQWNKNSLLRLAIIHERTRVVQLLIAAGANPLFTFEVENTSRYLGLTPLQVALITRNTELARVLLNAGADPDCTDKEGLNLLYNAVITENTEFTELLVNAGAKVEVTINNTAIPVLWFVFCMYQCYDDLKEHWLRIDKLVDLLVVGSKTYFERANFSIHEGFIEVVNRVRRRYGDEFDDLLLGTVSRCLNYGALIKADNQLLELLQSCEEKQSHLVLFCLNKLCDHYQSIKKSKELTRVEQYLAQLETKLAERSTLIQETLITEEGIIPQVAVLVVEYELGFFKSHIKAKMNESLDKTPLSRGLPFNP